MGSSFTLTGAELGELYTNLNFIQGTENLERILWTRDWFQEKAELYWQRRNVPAKELEDYCRAEYRTQIAAVVPALIGFEKQALSLANTFKRTRHRYPFAVRNAALTALATSVLGDKVTFAAERPVRTWEERPAIRRHFK